MAQICGVEQMFKTETIRLPVRASDKRITCDEEFSDSEDEGDGGRRHKENFKTMKKMKLDEEKNGEKKEGK